MKNKYEIAAYYFPDYHADRRNEKWHGTGWTEWELVKRAEPRFEGHNQPKVPLWGYEDEADPEVMKKKINAAADNGITAFIFDWYWYEDGPYLQRALEEGFLHAENAERLKFSLMWANHDLADIHPAPRNKPYNILKSGVISPEAFSKAAEHMIATYFKHPSYWRVDGGLYFSIYEIANFIKIFGSIEKTKEGIAHFREMVRKAGLGELHLNAVVWGVQILPTESKISDINGVLEELGFDSLTSYVWIHHQELPYFPKTSYSYIREKSAEDFEKFTQEYRLPYYPNVTMGWDASPRTIQADAYDDLGYPFMSTLDGNTPEEFEKALRQAKEFLDRSPVRQKILTLNAWNEWTEGSYLEPDTVNGMKYLEAIKRVFKGTPMPKYPTSKLISGVELDKYRIHKGDGDMWPLTWAADGNIYGGAGDNLGSPLNFWKISGSPEFFASVYEDTIGGIKVELVDNMPLDPRVYAAGPEVHPVFAFKPSGIISVDGILYMSVSAGNYGEEKYWKRQRYINSWIITSSDYGKTWDREATDQYFFTGQLAGSSFLQFGKDYSEARDEYVYAYFPSSDEKVSFWENGDCLLLGRVHKEKILLRGAWEFYAGLGKEDCPLWVKDDNLAVPVFEYPKMTGQNHVSYNKGIGRYIMGNYSFIDKEGNPRPLHADEVERGPSQLTLFEAPEPWGPWSLFYKDDNWGTYGDYQPNFPTKWMSEDGKTIYMVSSGSYDDYNFTVQKLNITTP